MPLPLSPLPFFTMDSLPVAQGLQCLNPTLITLSCSSNLVYSSICFHNSRQTGQKGPKEFNLF